MFGGFSGHGNSIHNSYYVELPWDEDKIKAILANYMVYLRVLGWVIVSLEKKQLYVEYC